MLIIFSLILFLLSCGMYWFLLNKMIWKNIKESASIYTAHFNVEIDPSRRVCFKKKRKTPRDVQSYSYKRILRQVDILEISFAICFTTCLTVLVRGLFPPLIAFWDITSTAGIYILLFFPTYIWGARWIPNLIRVLLYFPQDRLPFQFDETKFVPLLKTDVVIGVIWGLLFNLMQSGFHDRAALLFFSFSFACLFAFCRFYPQFMVMEKYSSPWDTLENYYNAHHLKKIHDLQISLIEETCAHPNFGDWEKSLPPRVSSIVADILRGKEGIEFLATVDKSSPEDLQKYSFLEDLLCGNTEFMTPTSVDVLYEIQDAVKGYSPNMEGIARPA